MYFILCLLVSHFLQAQRLNKLLKKFHCEVKELTSILSKSRSSSFMTYNSWAMKSNINSLKHLASFDLNPGSSKLAVGMVTEVTGTTGISKRQCVSFRNLLHLRHNTSYGTPRHAEAASGHSYCKEDNYT